MPGLDPATLFTGVLVFLARVADVSLGTMRTLAIVHGRSAVAFLLGFVEIAIWLTVVSTVILTIKENPWLGVFYALGFSTGNVVGIKLERRLAHGHTVLRVITHSNGQTMSDRLHQAGFSVTTFQGQGQRGPVTELCVVCRRRDCKDVSAIVLGVEPDAFSIIEPAGLVSKMLRPVMPTATGWRALFKKK